MDYDHSQSLFIKSSSPLKPRFFSSGQARDHASNGKTLVSAMCENLLEGNPTSYDGRRRCGKHCESPQDYTYDRGLQCDSGYTMYTPVYTCQEHPALQTETYHKAPNAIGSQELNAETIHPSKVRCALISNDLSGIIQNKQNNKSIQEPFKLAHGRYVTHRSKEKCGVKAINNEAKGENLNRNKRKDKKKQKKSQACAKDFPSKFLTDLNKTCDWSAVNSQTHPNCLKHEVGEWELIYTTTPPVMKTNHQMYEEMYEQSCGADRNRHVNQQNIMPASRSNYNDCCLATTGHISCRYNNESANRCHERAGNYIAAHHRDFFERPLNSFCPEEESKVCYCKDLVHQCAASPLEEDTQNIRYNLLKNMTMKHHDTYSTCNASQNDGLHFNAVSRNAQATEVVRAPWKCTTWETRAPADSSHANTWSCEMYSRTHSLEDDVGMAANDKYRSYIDARSHIKVSEKITKDVACQESLPKEMVQKQHNSINTQTDSLICANISCKMMSNHINDTVHQENIKNETNVAQTETEKVVQKNCLIPLNINVDCPSEKQANNKEKATSESTVLPPNEQTFLTAVTPEHVSQKLVLSSQAQSNTKCNKIGHIRNVLTSELKIPRIPELAGHVLNEVANDAGNYASESTNLTLLTSSQLCLPEKDERTNAETINDQCSPHHESKKDRNKQQHTNPDVNNLVSKQKSPIDYCLSESIEEHCAGGDRRFVVPEKDGTLKKRKKHKFAELQKTINAFEKLSEAREIKDYEKYKEGRRKYVEEITTNGCEFEIEELKFQKQISYDSRESKSKKANLIANHFDNLYNENIGKYKESIQVLESPSHEADQQQRSMKKVTQLSKEQLNPEKLINYLPKCYKKYTTPPGDPRDITPCLTCSTSSSRNSSLSSQPSSFVKKPKKKISKTQIAKEELSKRQKSKTAKQKCSRNSRRSQSSSSVSSSGRIVKKKTTKRHKSATKRSENKGKRQTKKKCFSPTEKQSKRKEKSSSSSSSSSAKYKESLQSSDNKEDEKERSHGTVDIKESVLNNNEPQIPKGSASRSKLLRTHVKKQYKVNSPELLGIGDTKNTQKENQSFFQTLYSSPNFLIRDADRELSFNHFMPQRYQSLPRNEPPGNLSTNELQMSFFKLYKEIHRLQRQLEMTNYESDIPSISEKTTRKSRTSPLDGKTVPSSSLDQQMPECDSLNTTLKETSLNTTTEHSSEEWVTSTKLHLKKEKATKSSHLTRRPQSATDQSLRSELTPVKCRQNSPAKIPKSKGIPPDLSQSRAARYILTNKKAPCKNCFQQPSYTNELKSRAHNKHKSQSPNGGLTDPSYCWDRENNDNDSVLASQSKRQSVEERPESTLINVRKEHTHDHFNVRHSEDQIIRDKRGDGLSQIKGTVHQENFTNELTENGKQKLTNYVRYPIFEDDLHLHLTSSRQQGENNDQVYSKNFSETAGDDPDVQSIRSFVCSTNCSSSPSHLESVVLHPEREEKTPVTFQLYQAEKIKLMLSKERMPEPFFRDRQVTDGNNSKLDENESGNETSKWVVRKIPTSQTCRKLKIFGTPYEQTLQFYNSSILMLPSDNAPPKKTKLSTTPQKTPQYSKNEFTNAPDERERKSKDKMIKTVEPPTANRIKHQHSESRLSDSKKSKILYSVPQHKYRNKTPPPEELPHEPQKNPSIFPPELGGVDLLPYSSKMKKKKQLIERENSEIPCAKHLEENVNVPVETPKQTFSDEGLIVESNVHEKRQESPIEKIIELLSEKTSLKENVVSARCIQTQGTFANTYETAQDNLLLARQNQELNNRKVFQPNKTYSDFERSPKANIDSRNLLSNFIHQNVQQIADYIPFFKENSSPKNKYIGTMKPWSQVSGKDRRVRNSGDSRESSLSSNNIYGQWPPGVAQSIEKLNKSSDHIYLNDIHEDIINKSRTVDGVRSSRHPYGQDDQYPEDLSPNSRIDLAMKNSEKSKTDDDDYSTNRSEYIQSRNVSKKILKHLKEHHISPTPQSYIDKSMRDRSPSPQCSPLMISQMLSDNNDEALSPRQMLSNAMQERQSSTLLKSVNNNSNQGGCSADFSEDEIHTRSSGLQQLTDFSKYDFGPKNVAYISSRGSKASMRNELSNVANLNKLKHLNLVECVKNAFFKSFKIEAQVNPKKDGKHAKSSPKQKNNELATEDAGMKSPEIMKTMEETMLCEYINGRKKNQLTNENVAPQGMKSPFPFPQRPQKSSAGQSHYMKSHKVSKRRHSAKKLNQENSFVKQKLTNDIVDAVTDDSNKNSILSYKKLNICNVDTKNSAVPSLTSQWGGKKSMIKIPRCGALIKIEDADKAISHYSDAIKTGRMNSTTSERPFNESFPDRDGCYGKDDKYGSFISQQKQGDMRYNPSIKSCDTQIRRSIKQEKPKMTEKAKPDTDIMSLQAESSIMSSLEKIMQDKRPCFAEHCDLRHKDRLGPAEYLCMGVPCQHYRIHAADLTDGNNSSNESGNESGIGALCEEETYLLTPQSLNVMDRKLLDTRPSLQCQQMLLIRKGDKDFFLKTDKFVASVHGHPDEYHDNAESNVSNNLYPCSEEGYKLENCSDIPIKAQLKESPSSNEQAIPSKKDNELQYVGLVTPKNGEGSLNTPLNITLDDKRLNDQVQFDDYGNDEVEKIRNDKNDEEILYEIADAYKNASTGDGKEQDISSEFSQDGESDEDVVDLDAHNESHNPSSSSTSCSSTSIASGEHSRYNSTTGSERESASCNGDSDHNDDESLTEEETDI